MVALFMSCVANAQLPKKKSTADSSVVSTMSMAARVALIPDVVGKPENDAINTLAWTKLSIVRLDSMITSGPVGIVLSQRPQANTPVSRARAETLFVSGRPQGPGRAKINLSELLGQIVSGIVVQDRTHVPDLNGRTPSMVASALKQAGLSPGDATRDYSDEIPEGKVFRQHPPAETEVLTGSKVSVWYSIGPHPQKPSIIVPAIIGLSPKEAADSLKRVGLIPGHVDYVIRPDASGTVTYQSPSEGNAAHANDPIDFTVANPPSRITVPDVTGLSRADAEATLNREGLAVGRVRLVAIPNRDTTIIKQSPSAKSLVDSGTMVDLVENRPAEDRRVTVPDLSGKTLFDAASKLRLDSLLLGEVVRLGRDSSDIVSAQRPPPGQSVFVNTQVNIALGRGAAGASVVVPPVVNLSVDSAQLILKHAGFTKISMSGKGELLTSLSIVESQSPIAGTLTAPDVLVSLVTRQPPPPLPVPRLIGRTPEEARTIAEFDNLRVRVTSEARGFRFDDRVVNQNPMPLAQRPADNTIDVSVEVPLLSPIAAIVLLIAVVGMGWLATQKLFSPHPPAPAGSTVVLVPVVKEARAPVLSTDSHESLISAGYALRFDVISDPVTAEVPDEAIIKSEELYNA